MLVPWVRVSVGRGLRSHEVWFLVLGWTKFLQEHSYTVTLCSAELFKITLPSSSVWSYLLLVLWSPWFMYQPSPSPQGLWACRETVLFLVACSSKLKIIKLSQIKPELLRYQVTKWGLGFFAFNAVFPLFTYCLFLSVAAWEEGCWERVYCTWMSDVSWIAFLSGNKTFSAASWTQTLVPPHAAGALALLQGSSRTGCMPTMASVSQHGGSWRFLFNGLHRLQKKQSQPVSSEMAE